MSIIGAGHVGISALNAMAALKVCSQFVLVDVLASKVHAEALDCLHATACGLTDISIKASTDLSDTAGSSIVVITAGVRKKPEESRASSVETNSKLYQSIIPQIAQACYDALVIIVTNPVEELCLAAWRLSGFPCSRIIGTGTSIDSARMRRLIADAVQVSPQNVSGFVIGDHGSCKCLRVWFFARVLGINFSNFIRDKPEVPDEIAREIVEQRLFIMNRKGYTNWPIGDAISSLVDSILNDLHKVDTVSIYAKGMFGIDFDTFISLPVRVGRQGVVQTMPPDLTESEQEALKKIAAQVSAC